MSRCTDNQEVGLEAAILERVRNSSLVECRGADNPPGLSLAPKLRMRVFGARGRGASRSAVKAERKRRWSGRECECRHE